MASSKLELEVVGMNHRLTISTLQNLADDVPLHCTLEREPDNEHDPNAVRVIVIEKPWRKAHGGLHVGYIARATASVIAPRMDEGKWPYVDAWLTEIDREKGKGVMLLSKKKGSTAE
jgi:hypothetical protein